MLNLGRTSRGETARRAARLASLITATAFAVTPALAHAAEVRLVFPGLAAGGVVWAVQNTAEAFSKRGKPVAHGTVATTAGTAEVVVDLPPGEYAAMAYLDRNRNGRLDTLPVGLPTEPYGFSNNARGRLGPPAWEKARFSVSSAGARQLIRLR